MATVFRDVVYGDHPNQRVNLYQPEDYDFITDTGINIKGVILWIHGGGWQNGHKDTNKTNFSNYFLPGDLSVIQQLADLNSLDDDACQILSDLGYFVISANYRLISTGNPNNSVAALNTGGGEYPNSVEDIRELYKYMTVPNYGIGINALTWQLIVRYTQTYGLLVLGGSAGGQLAVAGVFEGAGNSGQWPRGLGGAVAPMNLFSDQDNPISITGRDLIQRYTNSSEVNQKLASPWWRRNSSTDPQSVGYENYLGFSDTSNPDVSHNKMKFWMWYNQNDVLVPTNTIEPFVDWARTALGNQYVQSTKVSVNDPALPIRYRGEWNAATSYVSNDVVYRLGRMFQAIRTVPLNTAPNDPPDNFYWSYGPDASHNLPPDYSVEDWGQEAAKFVFYSGVNYPKFQSKLRPTQGIMYPRIKNTGYKPPPPSYTLTAAASPVNEGSNAVFNLVTTGVIPNTVFYYNIEGATAQDLVGGALDGTVSIDSNGEASISLPLANDLTTEGPEILEILLRRGSFSGEVIASATVAVNDTSVNNEILTLPSSVSLGNNFTTSVTGGQPNTTASFTWTRNGSQISSGQITLDANGSYSSSIGSYNQSGTYVLRLTFAGSGNIRQATMTVNPESISIPGSVQAFQVFAVSVSGGVPNTSFTFSWLRSGSVQLTGSGTLDSSGNYNSGNIASLSPAGSWSLQVTFSGSGNTRSASISVFENLTISPSQVGVNQTFNVNASGGVPNSGFSFTWRRNGVTVLSASGTLDGSGSFGAPGSFSQTGFYTLTVTFSSTGNTASSSVNVV